MKQSEELRVAIKAAKEAGKVIMRHYGQLHHIKVKTARLGIVTEADFEAQRIIKAVIRKAFPKAWFLAEEDKKHPKISNAEMWVVDPLDGTKNFSRGLKLFAVSIALVKNKKPVLGVVFDPATGDLFFAEKGKGAFLDGKRIHVSKVKAMREAFFDIPLSIREGMRAKGLLVLKKLMKRLGTLRILGAAAPRLAFIASGRLDAYIEHGTYPWDIMAGVLILQEAGGRVTDEKGAPFSLFSSDRQTIVASNGRIHAQIIRELNK
ncbi:MAG: inositol monophosphatase family protein [archaeon]